MTIQFTFKDIFPTDAVNLICKCFLDVFDPGEYGYTKSNQPNMLLITSLKWGSIGKVSCRESSHYFTDIIFEEPDENVIFSQEEVKDYINYAREEGYLFHDNRILLGNVTPENKIIAEELLSRRRIAHQSFVTWLLSRLEILGLGMDKSVTKLNLLIDSERDRRFRFPIKGTPSQFYVFLQKRLLEGKRFNPDQKIDCFIFSNDRKLISTIDPNEKYLDIDLSQGKNFVFIEVSLLPNTNSGAERSMLDVHICGNSTAFSIWNAIRRVIENNCLPNEFMEDSFPESRNTPKSGFDFKTESEIYENVINTFRKEYHRTAIRMYIKGEKTETICKKTGIVEKTLYNLISKFREKIPDGYNKFYR